LISIQRLYTQTKKQTNTCALPGNYCNIFHTSISAKNSFKQVHAFKSQYPQIGF
jgi:hypothetical protein